MRIAIIADDLTGAMDTAAPFAARGLRTWVFPEPALPDGAPDAEVIAVNTETRHVAPDAAAATVAACVGRLGGSEILLKKIDSTLRGNVAVEIAAAIAACGRPGVLVTPAMPTQGRVLRDGRLYVHGVPLAETAIGRDALSPPPAAPLIELLSVAAPGCHWQALGAEDRVRLPAHLVCDAATPADMEAIARCVLAAGRGVLACGSGGLAQALAALLDRPAKVAARIFAAGPLLCVVGSRTPQAQAQVAALAGAGETAVVEVSPGVEVDAPRAPVVVLRPGAAQGDPAVVAAALAAAAATVVREIAPAALVMTGGDTALACFRRLGADAVEVADEILPGLALGRIRTGGRTLAVVTKAGGFGDDDVLLRLRDRLA